MAKKRHFTTGELLLWGLSVPAIIVSFLIFDRDSWVTLAASIIGVTSFDIQCKGQSARTAAYNNFQRVLRLYFIHIQVLRRDDNISRNVRTHGCICACFVAEKSV